MATISDDIIDDLKNNPGKIYYDEELNEFQFIDGSLKMRPINHFNTNKSLLEWQNKILNHKHNYDVLRSLDEFWNNLRIDPEYYSRSDIQNLTPVDALNDAIERGIYPPPEVLLSLGDCFTRYMNFGGKADLEDIFFGKKKIGTGNYSARKSKKYLYKLFMGELLLNQLEDSDHKSQVKIAELFLAKHNPKSDADSFLRGFRRYRKNLISDK